MSLFDTLFPSHTRLPKRRRPPRSTGRRPHRRDAVAAERLEQRLALAVTFLPRFSTNAPGDITFASNTLMTALVGQPGNATQVANAQNGTGSDASVWNDDFWNMQYINIDPSGGTFNSSSATLAIPAGADVLFAGLYYGSRTNTAVTDDILRTVRFKGPGDASYATFTGAAGPHQVTLLGKVVGGVSNLPDNVQTYGAFVDVTDLVQTRGQGTYTVANVKGDPGIINHFAGWSLVVAYEDPAASLRNLTVFDGFADVSAANPSVAVNVNGFTAPPLGPVKANLGFVAYEGDLGITGDTASFDGGLGSTTLSNGTNPVNNFFNSSISTNGVTLTNKNPNYKNQLGFDADIIAIDGLIANGATSATLTLTSTQDQYYPGVVTSAIDLYAPKISVDKSVSDLNGGIVEPGDTLRYTIVVANDAAAFDTAANVLLNDGIPAFTAYKPNSLFITSGPNSSATNKTDAIDDDQAEALPDPGLPPISFVRFQLGTGAGGGAPPVGGELQKGESTTVTFDVIVGDGFPSAGLISNTAVVTYASKVTGKKFSATDTATIRCPPVADLKIEKTDSPATSYVPGQTTTYTITVSNLGPAAVPASTISDPLPAGTTFEPAENPGWTLTAGVLTRPTAPLAAGASIIYTLKLLPSSDRTGDLLNTATIAVPAGYFDPVLSNNTSTDTSPCTPRVGLGVTKSDGTATYVPGTSTTYTITVTNSGPSFVSRGSILDNLPTPVATSGNWLVTSVTGLNSTVDTLSGTGTISTLFDLASGGEIKIAFTVDTDSEATADLKNTVVVSPESLTQGSSTTATDTDTAVPTVNLLITKDDGKTTYVPGASTTYTIVATNTGPSFLAGGTIGDPLPAQVSSASWTATYSGAGSTGPAAGSGALNETVSLAVGGTATFTFTVQIKPDASGDLVNTATISPPPTIQGTPATATDMNTQANPQVLLSVTKDDGKTRYVPGTSTTYTIVVTNSGPSTLVGGTVTDTLPTPQGASGFWTATTTGAGSSVFPASGGNDINATIDLPVNGTATFLYTVNIKSTATGQLDNTVTVSPPKGTSGNIATATDTNFGPEPPLSVFGGLVVGSDDGCNGLPWVRVLDPNDGTTLVQFLAYEPSFRGSVRVATGDVTGDGVEEIIVAPGRNRIGEIRVFTQQGVELPAYRTFPFGKAWRGGVEVTAADFTGDNVKDIVAGMSSGTGMVSGFVVTPGASDPVANAASFSFRGFPPRYAGGVMLASGDFGTSSAGGFAFGVQDGRDEIVVGSNSGMRAMVNIWSVTSTPKIVRTIFPFGTKFTGGVTLSTAKYDSDSIPDMLVGAGIGGKSVVEIYSGATGQKITTLPPAAFGSFSKPNAAVFTAALDLTGDGPATNVYGVQGRNGGRGTSGVSSFVRVTTATGILPKSTGNLPALRIAPLKVRLLG
ncbi:MAG: DUF11 domain-containing protein [Planctomycetia bacterium]|nr:DUF11 domain-containing protein [Planctomycetia bacterium]